MKKKIGIITFHSAHNYGASLQCYALQETLKNSGYDAYVINYRNKKIDKNFKIIKLNYENIVKFIRSIMVNIVLLKDNIIRYNKFESFIKDNFNLTRKYKNEEELKKQYPKFDVYITGSDQVWSYSLLGELEDSYTLNFGDSSIKRISYAASVGNPESIDENKIEFEKKLNSLNDISVREIETKDKLEKIINKKINVVLDPTLLLKKEIWDRKIKEKNLMKEKYIFVYAIGEHIENLKVANYLSKITGLKIVHVEKKNKYDNILKKMYATDPFEFINLIKNAEYVITTSFHATVFSLIYNKRIWAVPPKDTGCRITNLLNLVGMSDRYIYSLEEFKDKTYDSEIDYISVNNILDNERKKSIYWLKKVVEE